MNKRPKLLDLFCGVGGAAMGYQQAGFDVVGVDNKPQKHYPFKFYRGDALRVLANLIDKPSTKWAAIHASPPCQLYSVSRHTHNKTHLDLVGPVRDLIQKTNIPYVIENVPGAQLIDPLVLCGTQFNLSAKDIDGEELWLKRHRLFESNVLLVSPGSCKCAEMRLKGITCGGVYGGGPQNRSKDNWKGYEVRRGGYTPCNEVKCSLMGIDWVKGIGINQAIPPAYTEYIGGYVFNYVT